MEGKDFLTPAEIAKELNICYHNALAFVRWSGISYIRIGRTYRVRRDVFDQFIMQEREINISKYH